VTTPSLIAARGCAQQDRFALAAASAHRRDAEGRAAVLTTLST